MSCDICRYYKAITKRYKNNIKMDDDIIAEYMSIRDETIKYYTMRQCDANDMYLTTMHVVELSATP